MLNLVGIEKSLVSLINLLNNDCKIPCDLVINGVLTTFDIIMEPGLVDTLKSLDNQIESDTNKLLSSSVKVTTYDGSYIYLKDRWY